MDNLSGLMEQWEESSRKVMAQCDDIFDTLPDEFKYELVNFMLLQSRLVLKLVHQLKEENDGQPE